MEKIQSVLCCKQEDQPVLLIIALGDDDANHVYWYTILKKRFTQPQSLLPIKGDISQASISTVPFNAVKYFASNLIRQVLIQKLRSIKGI
jgi:hypothetical protein